jgi:hypothetical protein
MSEAASLESAPAFDLLLPDFDADPFPTYRAMREQAPLYEMSFGGATDRMAPESDRARDGVVSGGASRVDAAPAVGTGETIYHGLVRRARRQQAVLARNVKSGSPGGHHE